MTGPFLLVILKEPEKALSKCEWQLILQPDWYLAVFLSALMSSPGKKKANQFVVFAIFCGVNMPIMANFKLPT